MLPLSLSFYTLRPGSAATHLAHFLPGLLSSLRGCPVPMSASLVLRLYCCIPQAFSFTALLPLPLMTSGMGNSCHLTTLHAALHSCRPLNRGKIRTHSSGTLECCPLWVFSHSVIDSGDAPHRYRDLLTYSYSDRG